VLVVAALPPFLCAVSHALFGGRDRNPSMQLQAEVGFAMGGGVDVASEVASVVLLGDRPLQVPGCVCRWQQ
jgi:hypothetical protein